MAIKTIHLKTGERKDSLGKNNKHAMISVSHCENRHKFIMNMETKNTDIDNHAYIIILVLISTFRVDK